MLSLVAMSFSHSTLSRLLLLALAISTSASPARASGPDFDYDKLPASVRKELADSYYAALRRSSELSGRAFDHGEYLRDRPQVSQFDGKMLPRDLVRMNAKEHANALIANLRELRAHEPVMSHRARLASGITGFYAIGPDVNRSVVIDTMKDPDFAAARAIDRGGKRSLARQLTAAAAKYDQVEEKALQGLMGLERTNDYGVKTPLKNARHAGRVIRAGERLNLILDRIYRAGHGRTLALALAAAGGYALYEIASSTGQATGQSASSVHDSGVRLAKDLREEPALLSPVQGGSVFGRTSSLLAQ